MSKPDDEAAPTVLLMEPSTAAERIGVSASGLRRLAPIYEAVHGELPRRGTGAEDKRARLWPQDAVERLQAARNLVDRERYRTILEALRALQSGVSTEDIELELGGRQTGSDVAIQQTLDMVLKELAALRAEVGELRTNQVRAELHDESPPKKKAHDSQNGLLVRVALWLETRLRGNRE